MKVMKIEILVLNFDDLSEDEISDVFEQTKYPNRCISPEVKKIQSVDIGEWDDDHPLNKLSTCDQTYSDLFGDHPLSGDEIADA